MSDSDDDADEYLRATQAHKHVSKSMMNLGIDLKLSDFAKKDFKPKEYVMPKAQVAITQSGVSDLALFTKKMSEETAQKLKRNVFDNYPKFINTSKEISKLESDLQDLRNLFSDSTAIMKAIAELSSAYQENQSSDNQPQRMGKLTEIMDMVENCPNLLNVDAQEFLYEENFTEVDELTYDEVRQCHIFVFTASVLVTKHLPQAASRRQMLTDDKLQYRYSFLYLWDMTSLLIIDINRKNKNPDEIMNAFRVMHPLTTVFKAAKQQEKLQFLNLVNAQQKRLKDAMVQKQERRKVEKETQSQTKNGRADIGSLPTSDIKLLTEQEWLLDMPDDLDVYIAQRDFDKAVALVQRTREMLASNAIESTVLKSELNVVLESRTARLTAQLVFELQSANMKVPAMLEAVNVCIALGQPSKAQSMYLNYRREAMKKEIKRLRFEGATEAYISRLFRMVYSNIQTVMGEFTARFPGTEDRSAFVAWAVQQVKHCVDILQRQVFHSNDLGTMAKSLEIARNHMAPLAAAGLDLHYVVVQEMRGPLSQALKAEAAAVNNAAEGKMATSQPIAYRHMFDSHSFMLHPSTHAFCTATERFVENISHIDYPELEPVIIDLLKDLFEAQADRLVSFKTVNQEQPMADLAVDKDYLVNTYLDHVAKTLGDCLSEGKKVVGKIQRNIATRLL